MICDRCKKEVKTTMQIDGDCGDWLCPACFEEAIKQRWNELLKGEKTKPIEPKWGH